MKWEGLAPASAVWPNRAMDLLAAIRNALPGTDAAQAQHVADAMGDWGIVTPDRMAAFTAQVGHESRDLSRLVESFNYSRLGLLGVFPGRISAEDASRLARQPGERTVPDNRQAEMAELAYGNRPELGNVEQGDGWRFRGRGAIQLTGRGNYRRAGEALGLPLVERPDLLGELPAAIRSAAWFWAENGCNELADAGEFERITRKINGGLNGQDDRLARWRRAKLAFGTQTG